MVDPIIESQFMLLAAGDYRVTSPADPHYNCAGHAANRREKWWPLPPFVWPKEAPRENTIAAFVQAYATLGYSQCPDGKQEKGFEKLAIYANLEGPTHVARQLSNGKWTSKLGAYKDIEHRTPESLTSSQYGRPVRFMRRPVRKKQR
jgi:hypothetical protein